MPKAEYLVLDTMAKPPFDRFKHSDFKIWVEHLSESIWTFYSLDHSISLSKVIILLDFFYLY